MKSLTISLVCCLLSNFLTAQNDSAKIDSSSYLNIIYTNEINKIKVFDSDTLNDLVEKIIREKKLAVPDKCNHPKAYFTNRNGNKYLEIWGGTDIGYSYFYTIGYTKDITHSDCALYMGKDTNSDYVVNHDIKLGDSLMQVWQKAHFAYFRTFSFRGITGSLLFYGD